jgi:HTH-type transcriptional regulator/antitoxin HipB
VLIFGMVGGTFSTFTAMAASMNRISEIIKTHRRKAGLSQIELARFAGVGKTVIFDLEHGKESIRYDTLAKVLSVLNVKIRFESPLLGQAERRESVPRT